ncbi:hypothetical protein [Massilia sp. BKSP1R2A-1]|uniref:hypothetical protein n=1 Tax=Massilia sp. BKSP1R2A-1 TaxID=3422595 RepID=UPI003D3573AB
MKVSKFISALLVVACFMAQVQTAFAADAPKIAFSTKFGGIDFLFTEDVDRAAKADGSDFQFALREVGFELISAVGKAAASSPGLQAILIDRIKFKETKALVVLGVIADGKFASLNYNGKAPNSVLEKFAAGLEENHVSSLRVANGVGVELFIQPH